MGRGGRRERPQAEYSATCGHTLVAGNMLVFRKEYGNASVKQGGTAGNVDDSSLTDFTRDLSGTFLLYQVTKVKNVCACTISFMILE